MLSFLFLALFLFRKQFMKLLLAYQCPWPSLAANLRHLLACSFFRERECVCVCSVQRKWRQARVTPLCLPLMPLHSLYSHRAGAPTAANLLFISKVCSALSAPFRWVQTKDFRQPRGTAVWLLYYVHDLSLCFGAVRPAWFHYGSNLAVGVLLGVYGHELCLLAWVKGRFFHCQIILKVLEVHLWL